MQPISSVRTSSSRHQFCIQADTVLHSFSGQSTAYSLIYTSLHIHYSALKLHCLRDRAPTVF